MEKHLTWWERRSEGEVAIISITLAGLLVGGATLVYAHFIKKDTSNALALLKGLKAI